MPGRGPEQQEPPLELRQFRLQLACYQYFALAKGYYILDRWGVYLPAGATGAAVAAVSDATAASTVPVVAAGAAEVDGSATGATAAALVGTPAAAASTAGTAYSSLARLQVSG